MVKNVISIQFLFTIHISLFAIHISLFTKPFSSHVCCFTSYILRIIGDNN